MAQSSSASGGAVGGKMATATAEDNEMKASKQTSVENKSSNGTKMAGEVAAKSTRRQTAPDRAVDPSVGVSWFSFVFVHFMNAVVSKAYVARCVCSTRYHFLG